MKNTNIQLLQLRRSIYALGRNISLSAQEISELIQESIRQSPSSFNSQSSRALILFGNHHQKIWELAEAELKTVVPVDAFEGTQKKLATFKAGFGTVLFFEDQRVISGLQEKFALYAENFPIWSEQSSGMAQLAVWTTLADVGIGASLQHYNPLIDHAVQHEWGISTEWKLRAQMPFGSIESSAGPKEIMPDEDRFDVFY